MLSYRKLQAAGSNIPPKPLESEETWERNESPFPRVDSPCEGTVIIYHAKQANRADPIQQPAKPSTPSPPFKQSTSTSPSLPVLALVKMAPSRMHTPRGTLPYEPPAPSRGTLFESPRPPGGDGGKAFIEEQGHKDPSATPHGLPVSPDHAPATTNPSTLRQPVWPHHLDRSNSRIHANEGVGRGAERAMEGPLSERKDRKRVFLPEERENHLEDSANTEPNPTTSHTLDVILYLKPPQESSGQLTYSHRSREYDFSASRLPQADTSDFRGKVGRSSNAKPPLDRRETPITPSSALVSTRNQPKDVIRARSINNSNSTVSSTDSWPGPSSLLGDSKTLATSSDKSPIVSHHL